ncbi:MAG: glycosyltransferase [Nanobdellota archaeon]
MNVAIFSDTFLPQINGIVTATLNLAKGMADRGHTVHLIVPKFKTGEEFKYKNVNVVRVPSMKAYFYEGFRFSLFFNPFIFNYIKKNDIEVIHFETPVTLGVEAIINAKLSKIPIVGTFHTFIADKDYLKHIGMDNRFFELVTWKYINFFNNSCDLVTSPSNFTAKELQDKGCKKDIKVISNGIDLSKFDNSRKDLIKKKYDLKGKTLLYIGRIAYEKNIEILLKAFSKIVKEEPHTKLILVGGGPQEAIIDNIIDKMGLDKNVVRTGPIPYNELIKSGIFWASDIFVTASVTENQPMTILEAMANNLPCIGPDAKGIPDLIENNKTGYLCKPNDFNDLSKKIKNLLNDKDKLDLFKINTNQEIKKHTVENIVSEWEKTYEKLTKKTKK